MKVKFELVQEQVDSIYHNRHITNVFVTNYQNPDIEDQYIEIEDQYISLLMKDNDVKKRIKENLIKNSGLDIPLHSVRLNITLLISDRINSNELQSSISTMMAEKYKKQEAARKKAELEKKKREEELLAKKERSAKLKIEKARKVLKEAGEL